MNPAPATNLASIPGVRRAAFTLLEVTIAAALLAVLLNQIVQTYLVARRNERRLDDRALAVRTVENLMEQLTAGPWDDVTSEAVAELRIPADLARRWPRAVVSGAVIETTDPVVAKRVMLSLRTGAAPRERPVTLTTWIFLAPER